MSMDLQISPGPGVLKVRLTGQFSLPEANTTFLEMLEVMRQHKVCKLLVDARELEGNPTVIERFYYSTFAAQTVANHVVRAGGPAPQFAYVLKEPVLDPRRFGEDVARNRGMEVRAFSDLNEARAWLSLALNPAQRSTDD